MLIDDYIEYMKIYREQYGNKCIVFLQVGSFYEMYTISEYNNDDYDIYKIADICGIQTTKKNKSINEKTLKIKPVSAHAIAVDDFINMASPRRDEARPTVPLIEEPRHRRLREATRVQRGALHV